MKIPPKASGACVHYGEVYIESLGNIDLWDVWDPRLVRQGARLVGEKLSFRAAEALALRTAAKCTACGGSGKGRRVYPSGQAARLVCDTCKARTA
jgi:hypothetical protein